MARSLISKWGLAALVLAFALGGDAQAGWWHGSSGGSSGGWGSSGGSSGGWRPFGWLGHVLHPFRHGSSGGSSGGWGSSGGYAPRYYYHGSSGGWGSSGGVAYSASSGGWASSGSAGGYYSPSPGTVVTPPTTTQKPAPAEEGGAAPGTEGKAKPGPAEEGKVEGKQARSDSSDSTLLSVSVPADAKIFVNGKETVTPGELRQFVSRNLNPGYRYTYRIRAEIVRDGETIDETKVLEVRAGYRADVAFDFDRLIAQRKKSATKLTVRVPEDAKLILAGRETKQTGAVRSFSTTALSDGSAWQDYTVRAVVVRDGQTLTKDLTLTLKAGDHQDVTIDFDALPVLASATGEAVR